MAKDIKALSTKELRRKIKAATFILVICWSAVIVAMIMALSYGKSQHVLASSAGFIGLFVTTIAMWIGMKKAKEEIASRDKN